MQVSRQVALGAAIMGGASLIAATLGQGLDREQSPPAHKLAYGASLVGIVVAGKVGAGMVHVATEALPLGRQISAFGVFAGAAALGFSGGFALGHLVD